MIRKTKNYRYEISGYEKPKREEVKVNPEETMYRIYKAAEKFYSDTLKDPEKGKTYRNYLKYVRQLSDSDIDRFGLGASPGYGSSLYRFLMGQGFREEDIMASKLVREDKNGEVKDVFYERVMFPIYNRYSEVIAFGGRTLEKNNKCKYINSQETDIFRKHETLYMFNEASRTQCGAYILCEGYMDVIAMHKAGFTNAVASLGTSLTEDHADMLAGKSRVYIMYDSDQPGVNAAMRAIPMLGSRGIDVRVINLNPYKDPDEMFRTCREDNRNGEVEMVERLKNSVSAERFIRMNYREDNARPEVISFLINRKLTEIAERDSFRGKARVKI